MSLRIRLILSIAVVVMLATAALSIIHLDTLANSLAKDALDRANLAGQQVELFVKNYVNQNSALYEAPSNPEGVIQLWNNLISDPQVSSRLLDIMAPSPAILEINVAGQTREVLASSNPLRISAPLPDLPLFAKWHDGSLRRRMTDLFVRRLDYQIQVPLGEITSARGAGNRTIFTIQVITSSVLLREALLPDVEWLAGVSGGAVVLSLLLTALTANWILQPLRRIERTIDRISQGNYGTQEIPVGMAKEFAAVESKLKVLGEQFRGAREAALEAASEKQHSVDKLLERMASQLDVASRLAAISRISGGVAHEIKNPLNAISLRLDLLRERLGAPEEELRPEIDILSNEVRRLDRVVKTFLNFTRPVEVKFESVDLAALAREVAELMKPQARSVKIAVAFESAADHPARIRGDADMLKQAILNLVTNALDAMSPNAADHAPAQVAPGELSLRVSNSGDNVRLEVADNGPGIPEGVRDKVFQLYFTTKQRGSGIGLAMTYRAVQLHNGTIDFTSEDGRGTTFFLQFPALAGPAAGRV
jgi:signal transduction histidine kinase